MAMAIKTNINNMNKKEMSIFLYKQLKQYREKEASLWETGGKKIYNNSKDSIEFINNVCNPTSKFVSFVLDNYK